MWEKWVKTCNQGPCQMWYLWHMVAARTLSVELLSLFLAQICCLVFSYRSHRHHFPLHWRDVLSKDSSDATRTDS